MPRVLRGAEPSWREMGLRKTVPDLVREPADIGDRRLRTSIFLVRRLRRISHWVIRRGIAEKLVRPLPWLGGWRALHAQGWIAGVTRRHADHTDFWREAANLYPKNSVFTRNMVHAALRAGRFAEADTGLTALIEGRKTIVGDCRFVIGLTFVDLRRGDVARIRKRVRSILVSFRGTAASRIAAVRLSRVIFAHFPPKARDQSGGERSWRLPFVHMLSCSGVKPEPKKVLLRVAECEAQLERVFPGCLFDTDISAAQCRTFVSLVRARLLRRQPFAFVRAGDGEAACLPYEPRLASHAEADARERELIWWGRSLAPALRARIATAVARAIWDADCIGIPTIARFLREVRLDRRDSLEHSLTGRGLRSLLYCSERFTDLRSAGLPDPIFTSCHLHQDLAIWNCYEELLDGVRDVVFISCHAELAELARERFGVSVAASLVLPADKVSGPFVAKAVSESADLPEMLDSVIERIGDLARGRLVLIGAGYPGKILASVVRERGGIALDVGSIFDYWLGLRTRSYLDLDSG